METNVTTLETSRKLKVAGFPQGKASHWWHRIRHHHTLEWGEWKLLDWQPTGDFAEEHAAAPTAQEIAGRLRDFTLYHNPGAGRLTFKVADDTEKGFDETGQGPTMAEALASLYLASAENGALKL